MSEERRRYISYLLRLWQTERGGALVWCASLESPATGERQGFAGLAELFAFLEQETAPAETDEQRTPADDGVDAQETGATEHSHPKHEQSGDTLGRLSCS